MEFYDEVKSDEGLAEDAARYEEGKSVAREYSFLLQALEALVTKASENVNFLDEQNQTLKDLEMTWRGIKERLKNSQS